MNEVLRELDTAYKAISSIPVSDDAVDAMAVARAKLRNVYAELVKMNEAKEENSND